MKTRNWIVRIASLLVGCLSALPAPAQQTKNERPKWEFFAEGGASVHTEVSGTITRQFVQPPGTFTQKQTKFFAKTGRLFTGLRYHFDSKNHIEATYSYSPARLNTTVSGFPFAQPRTFVMPMDYDYFSVNYVRRLPSRKRFEPFLTAGVGLVVFSSSFEKEPGPVGNFGVGFDIPLNRRFSFRVEQRFFISGTPRLTLVIGGTPGSGLVGPNVFDINGNTFDIVPSVGLVWHF